MSKGANIVFEQAAAKPEARVFLSPLVTALLFDLFDAGVCIVVVDFVRPPRGMLLIVFLADGRAQLLSGMLNNPADATPVCVDRRHSKRIVHAFMVCLEVIGIELVWSIVP